MSLKFKDTDLKIFIDLLIVQFILIKFIENQLYTRSWSINASMKNKTSRDAKNDKSSIITRYKLFFKVS